MMKNLKIILLYFNIIFLFSSCGIFHKTSNKNKEEYKTEIKDKIAIVTSDSTKTTIDVTTKSEKDSIHLNIYQGADSIRIIITEEKIEDKIITKKDIIVYRPVKHITTDSKTERQLNTVIVDSTSVNKTDYTASINEKTSSVKLQEISKKSSWSVPWYVYLGGGFAIVIIIFYIIRKWTSGESLMDMLKKFLGRMRN